MAVVLRKPPISGMESSATALYRVRQDQFIYSRLFAFEGAYGLVTRQNSMGATSRTNSPRSTAIEAASSPNTWDCALGDRVYGRIVARLSTGIGDRRRRVQPDQFLTHSIPLPSLSEQRRIVTKVEGLATKIEEARGLRDSADEDVAGLSVTVSAALVENDQWPMVPLKDILREDSRNGLGSRPSDSPPACRFFASVQEHHVLMELSMSTTTSSWNYRKAMQRLTPCCPAIF